MSEPKRILRVTTREGHMDHDGFSSDPLDVAVQRTVRQAKAEGWSEWQLIERGRTVAKGDEVGAHFIDPNP